MAKLGASSPERDQEMDARYREAFQSEAGRKKRKKGIKAFFCITLVLSVLVSLLNWGIITGWGNVKVERLTLSGYNGDRISALLYIPKNATSETPAPLVFNCHGNAGNGRNHESWAVEFARRGFVVLSVDLYGSGDSENSAESFASMAMLTSVTYTFYEHMLNRDYVDKDNILIGAHSMGGSVAAGLAGKYQPKGVMSASGALGGQFNGVEGAEERVEMIGTYVGDVLLDFGDVERDEASLCSLVQDWLDSRVGYDGYEGVEYTQVGQIAGSFEEGNAVVGLLDTNRVHEAAFVNQETIGNLIWFAQEAVGDAVPNYGDRHGVQRGDGVLYPGAGDRRGLDPQQLRRQGTVLALHLRHGHHPPLGHAGGHGRGRGGLHAAVPQDREHLAQRHPDGDGRGPDVCHLWAGAHF